MVKYGYGYLCPNTLKEGNFMNQFLALMQFIADEINCNNTELNAYVKCVGNFKGYTIVAIEFIPEGILPSGCYKLLSNFIVYNEVMQGSTISGSDYTDHGTLHGVRIRLSEEVPGYSDIYDKEV